jgi:hypothetical protein
MHVYAAATLLLMNINLAHTHMHHSRTRQSNFRRIDYKRWGEKDTQTQPDGLKYPSHPHVFVPMLHQFLF